MRLTKQLGIAIIILWLASLPLLTGCGSNQAAPAAPAPTAAASGSVPAKVYKFSLASAFPETHVFSDITKAWMARITEASKGQITFTYYPGETLVKGTDTWGALQKGAADVGYLTNVYFGGQEPLANLTGALPLLFDSPDHVAAVLQDPSIREVYTRRYAKHNITWLGASTISYGAVFSKDKAIVDVADFKGVPIATTGGPLAVWLQKTGASVTTLGSADLYTASERGMIKAWTTSFASQFALKLYEVSKHITDATLVAGANAFAMNQDAFKALPADLQQLLVNETKAFEATVLKMNKDFDGGSMKQLTDKGMVRNVLTKEQLAAWQALAKPQWAEFEKSLGDDGPAVMAAVEKARK